jgi:hypothetical protein
VDAGRQGAEDIAHRVSEACAINRRVILSRDRIITRKRNKLTIIAVAGALSMATAASAAAAAWPSGGASGAALTTLTVPSSASAAKQAPIADYLGAQHGREFAGTAATQTLLAQQATADQAAAHRAHAAQVAKEAAARQAAQQAAAKAAQQPRVQQMAAQQPAASGSPQSVAQAMLGSFGWSSSQFSCLQPLWAGESGWSVTASNPSSGAYGIPQALPGSKMASAGADWQTNPATQIKWGLGYIKSTYGSPCAAWSHEQSDGWY